MCDDFSLDAIWRAVNVTFGAEMRRDQLDYCVRYITRYKQPTSDVESPKRFAKLRAFVARRRNVLKSARHRFDRDWKWQRRLKLSNANRIAASRSNRLQTAKDT